MFELWDRASGNLVGTFGTQSEAYAAVREARQRNGDELAARLVLGEVGPDTPPVRIAAGAQLLADAERGKTVSPVAHAAQEVDSLLSRYTTSKAARGIASKRTATGTFHHSRTTGKRKPQK